MRWFLLLFFCLCSSTVFSQDAGPRYYPFSISPDVLYGHIWKHTKKFKPGVPDAASGVEINFQKQTTGRKQWQRLYNKPQYGISISALRFGNDDVLGYGFGFMPYIQLPIITRKHFRLLFRAGTGVAWLTKRYDVISDTLNDVIATHINDITSFAFRGNIELDRHSSLVFGAMFNHYSAGAARIPNLGINVPLLNIGYSYTFDAPVYKGDTTVKMEPRPHYFIFKNKLVLARFESFQANGPLYSQYATEMAIGKYLATWNKMYINADIFYNTFTYYYLLNEELSVGNQYVKSLGSSVGLEDEFLFNRVGVMMELGVILYQPYFSGRPYYEKAGVQYHFYNWGVKKRRNLFAGVYLKTHWAQAEHVETAVGIEW